MKLFTGAYIFIALNTRSVKWQSTWSSL